MKKLKVLVTGGEGFVGGRLCERLLSLGHEVTSLDNHFVGADVKRVDGVRYIVDHTKNIASRGLEDVDVVFHLGEYSRVEQSFAEPETVWDLNIAGTFAVVNFCIKNNRRLIYSASSTKFADDGAGKNQSPYAFFKSQNVELIKNYGQWYDLNYSIAYFYNVYGPGERAGKYGSVIRIFYERLQQGLPLEVTSPGTQERIFTHVDDIVDGLLAIYEKGGKDEYELGATKAYSILDVARMFKSAIVMTEERPGNRQKANIDLAKSHALGWKAKRSVESYIQDLLKHEPTSR